MSTAVPEAHEARAVRSTGIPLTDRITVYSHEAAIRRPGRMLKDMWGDLRTSSGLAWQLAMRDIRAQYRQSYLGYLWAFIMPLANTVVWIVLNSTGVVRVAETSIPYPAYVFTGTMIWQLLTEAVQSPLQQVSMSRNFLTKLNFPRESLVLAGVFKQLFGLAIKLAILVPVVMLLGVVPDLHLLLVPFALLAVVLTGISAGLLVSPIGLLYTDVARMIPLVAQFAMYTTPVIFAMPSGGTMARIFHLNPATPLVLTCRAWLTGGASPMLGAFLAVTATALVLLLIGLLLYRLALPILIERLST